MSDYSLINNLRELTELLARLNVDMIIDSEYIMKYSKGKIPEEMLENLIGKTLDLNDIILTETSSFKYGDRGMVLLSALCEDQCYIKEVNVPYTEQVNKEGSVSTVISTDPLLPGGICQSVYGGLLVTLRDNESDDYKLESHSRRLVRHITVTGDVIHEYEYQEDVQTRLFTTPFKVVL
ncbi:uncharacterized protein LOC133187015 [Saccostrea echinata]|uniref:uncharacterized protein LOC133187015 n=1 Tax=Saccostrea echinata TaxID=191078 RepID=UPI002A82DB2B|nr:uncharacterized protein LOC133187015 [Saccostrea echinata]